MTLVAFSPDSSHIVSVSGDSIVRIWNVATGEQEGVLEGHLDKVTSVYFSHDGRSIVSGSLDTTIRLWNATTCETVRVLKGPGSGVTSVSLSGNGKYVVSGSEEGTVQNWDRETGLLIRALNGHSDVVVESVAFSPDSQHIASGSLLELCIWSIEGAILHKLRRWARATSIAFSHDGCRVFFCDINVQVYHVASGVIEQVINMYKDRFGVREYPVAFSHNDPLQLIVGMEDGVVSVWDRTHHYSPAYNLTDHSLRVASVAFSPDDSRIVSGSNDRTVRIWNTELSGEAARKDTHHDGGITSITFSHDGGLVAFVWRSGSVRIWNMTKGEEDPPHHYTTDVASISFSRDGNSIVLVLHNGSIYICGPRIPRRRKIKERSSSPVTIVVAFSHRNCIVSGSSDKTVSFWDPYGKEIKRYQHSAGVTSVAFSWDDSQVVFALDDYSVHIWNLETDQIELTPKGHSDKVTSVAFSHDGSHVVSGSSDGTVLIWNMMTNQSTLLSQRVQLPDGTRVHSLSNGQFHIHDPVDQESTDNIPPYFLSITPNRDWIVGDKTIRDCWIPRQYRDFSVASVFGSTVCLGYLSGRFVILDLKILQEV